MDQTQLDIVDLDQGNQPTQELDSPSLGQVHQRMDHLKINVPHGGLSLPPHVHSKSEERIHQTQGAYQILLKYLVGLSFHDSHYCPAEDAFMDGQQWLSHFLHLEGESTCWMWLRYFFAQAPHGNAEDPAGAPELVLAVGGAPLRVHF